MEFKNSPPRHQCYSHMMNFMQQQSPPTAYGYNRGGTAGSYYLFPPPSSPASAVPQGGYEEIHTTLKQIGKSVHHQQQAHNPHMMPVTYAKDSETWSGFKAETDHRHKRSKSKTTKPVTAEGMMGSNPTPVSLGDVKQGKPAVKVDANRRLSKGRGRTPRDTSAVGHHRSKQQHQQST